MSRLDYFSYAKFLVMNYFSINLECNQNKSGRIPVIPSSYCIQCRPFNFKTSCDWLAFFLSVPLRVLDGLFKLSFELFGITIKVGLLRRRLCGILGYVHTTLYRIAFRVDYFQLSKFYCFKRVAFAVTSEAPKFTETFTSELGLD